LADTIDTTGQTIDSDTQFISGASQFGYATIVPLNQSGIGFLTPRAAFLSGSAANFQCTYFDINGAPLEPAALSYQIVDLLSGEVILGPTQLPLQSNSNIIISAAQNAMVSVSRSCETHALLVSVTDGTDNVYTRRALFEIVRTP
jgi:hypothetical protein